jgi:ferritin-like protein
MEPNNSPGLEIVKDQPQPVHSSRRKFLQLAGATGILASVVASCSKGKFPGPPSGKHPGAPINLGSGDVGILNFAYALEQLEAAFYTIVIAVPYQGISAFEFARLKDIRDHEIAHREFFKTALGSNAIPALTPAFESINFFSRDSVLAASKSFEDLGVSAYNGAGSLISSPAYLTLAGKIVSVEARHAAFIRDLISPGSFADSTVVNANGLDTSRTPPEVLSIAGAYIVEKLDASNLPTS